MQPEEKSDLVTREQNNMSLPVKICGMKEPSNILEIAAMGPAYMGFIFAKKSPRYFEGIIPELPESVQKVGVFVAETIENVLGIVKKHKLQAVQLHGDESVSFCQELRGKLSSEVEIIKVFSVGSDFNFQELEPFEIYCDYFLLDTKGKYPGGNGTQFNWQILKNYKSAKPFFLSGGIGVEDHLSVKKLQGTKLPLHAIDCNSKLEVAPGLKNKEKCEELLNFFASKQ